MRNNIQQIHKMVPTAAVLNALQWMSSHCGGDEFDGTGIGPSDRRSAEGLTS
jgi:hypothetical protein